MIPDFPRGDRYIRIYEVRRGTLSRTRRIKYSRWASINRESLHKITPWYQAAAPFLPLCKHWTTLSLSLSVSFPAPITPDSTVKDDSGENGMPLAFLIPAFCHSLSIVTRRRLRSVHLGAATARSKWKIWRKKGEEEEEGEEKGGARFLPRRVAQSNYLCHATGINDKRIIFSLSLSLFPISILFVTGIALLQDDAKFGCLICKKGFQQQWDA